MRTSRLFRGESRLCRQSCALGTGLMMAQFRWVRDRGLLLTCRLAQHVLELFCRLLKLFASKVTSLSSGSL